MGIATRATKQILPAYKAVRCVKHLTQRKLDALLETNPRYKLFEHDAQHPYYTLATCGQNTLTVYEELIAGVMNWAVDSGTISEELDRLKAWQIVNDEAVDEEL